MLKETISWYQQEKMVEMPYWIHLGPMKQETNDCCKPQGAEHTHQVYRLSWLSQMEQTNPGLHPEFQGDPAEPHDGHGSAKGGKLEKKCNQMEGKSYWYVSTGCVWVMKENKQITFNVLGGSYFPSFPSRTGNQDYLLEDVRCLY